MSPNPTQQKYARLADAIFRALSPGEDWKRIRIAVTPEEYQEIQFEFFDNGSDAFNRIRSIVIVAEREPTNHPLLKTMCPKVWSR